MTIVDPGVNVGSAAGVTPQLPPTLTDTAFVAGVTAMGRTDQPVLVRSLQDYLINFGPRVSYGDVYDWLDAFFHEGGGGQVYILRVVGAAAVKDSVTLNDAGAAGSLTVQSIGEGTSGLSVAVQAGAAAGTYQLVVSGLPDGSTLTSPDLTTVQDAVNWGSTQLLVRVVAAGANPPVDVAATPLAGGNDQRAAITDATKVAALANIPKTLGPGQVVFPSATTEAAAVGLFNHAKDNNRFAVASAPDTASESTLLALYAAIVGDAGLEVGAGGYGVLVADWQVIPGIVPGTTRTVAPSAIAAALIARSDRFSGNPNLAPAGANGAVQWSLGKTQKDWTDAQASALVQGGVNVFRVRPGGSEALWGFRTLVSKYADPVAWMGTAGRLRMALQDEGDKIGASVLQAQIDGQQHTQAKYAAKITGMLLNYYNLGALYGATPADAYAVSAGADVNTPATIANGELHCVAGYRPSPAAEMVFLNFAVYPANVPL